MSRESKTETQLLAAFCFIALGAVGQISGAGRLETPAIEKHLDVWIKGEKNPLRDDERIRIGSQTIKLKQYINKILKRKKNLFCGYKIEYDKDLNMWPGTEKMTACAGKVAQVISLGPLFFDTHIDCRRGILLHECGHLKYPYRTYAKDALAPICITTILIYAQIFLLCSLCKQPPLWLASSLLLLISVVTEFTMLWYFFENFLSRREECYADLYAIKHLTKQEPTKKYINFCGRKGTQYKNWLDRFLNETHPSGPEYAKYLESQSPVLRSKLVENKK